MVRSGGTISALLALIAFFSVLPAAAQAPTEDVRIHTVAEGETLGSIAERYYGDSAAWPRIVDVDGNQIEDPNRISVGQDLRVPDVERRAHLVSRVDPAHDDAGTSGSSRSAGERSSREVETLEAVRARQALARFSTFEPAEAPLRRGERTVFFQDPALLRPETAIDSWQPEDLPAIPVEIFRGASWLLQPGEELEAFGRISDFAGDQDVRLFRTTIQHLDLVRGVFDGDRRPEPGERYLIVRLDREMDGVGTVVIPTGRARVRRVDSAGAVLEVFREYDRIQLGQYLVADRDAGPATASTASPTDEVLEASILAFEREREIQFRNDRAFLDVGRREGVRPGDEFVLVLGADDGWRGRPVARFQLVGVREKTSTARVLTTTSREVRAGLTVQLDRRMP